MRRSGRLWMGLAAIWLGCSGPVPGRADQAAVPGLLSPEALESSGLVARWKATLRDATPRRLHLGARSCYVETANLQVHALDRGNGFYKWIIPLAGTLQVPPGESILGPGQGDNAARDTAYFIAGNLLSAVDIHDPAGQGRESGRMLWSERLPFRATTPPVATDFSLAVGTSDGDVQVFQLREVDPHGRGEIRRIHAMAWHYDTGGEVLAAPILPADVPDQILSSSGSGILMSRSLRDGTLHWRYPYEGRMGAVMQGFVSDVVTVPSPTTGLSARAASRSERTLYVGAMDNTFQIIDAEGGALLSRTLLTDGVEQPPLVLARVLAEQDPDWRVIRDIYPVCRDGRLFAFRVEDVHRVKRDEGGQPLKDERGALRWVNEVADGDDVSGGEVEAAEPAAPEGGEEENGAPKALPREFDLRWAPRELWSASGVARVLCRGRNGLYVVGTDRRLRLLDPASGKEHWSRPLTGILEVPTLPQQGARDGAARLYLLDEAGAIWCLEEK